jgi:hypothetical protein
MHGSGLANVAFAQPPFWVIEMVSDGRFAPMFGRLTQAAGGSHVAVSLPSDPRKEQMAMDEALTQLGF